MVAGARAIAVCTLMTSVAGSAFAQASSVAIASPGPTPVAPLEVLDSDYPLEAMLANEEGETVLNLILAETGAVRVAQIVGSSSSPALDATAATVARARWSFQPQGAPPEVQATVTWKLPLSPRDDYAVDAPGPPADSVIVPPASKPGNRLVASDYPAASIRAGEEGEVILKTSIDETGRITNTELAGSSGIPRLDEAAIRAVRSRFVYEPAMLDGKPVAGTMTTFVFFSRPSRVRPLFCHERPVFSVYDRTLAQVGTRPTVLTRWFLVGDSNLRIDDVLLRTSKGWLQVSKSALSRMTLPGTYRLVRNGAAGQPCWIRAVTPIPS